MRRASESSCAATGDDQRGAREDAQAVALTEELGQVHRARTRDGEDVVVKVQLADRIDAELRDIGVVAPIIGRLAPGVDARRCSPRCASARSSRDRRR